MTAQSARGLFRATGNVAKQDKPRVAADFYPTPPEPTRALLASPEGGRLREFRTIWEPACGDGAMVREIRGAGFRNIVASDLHQRGAADVERDFFAYSRPPGRNVAIVTNPPYSLVNTRDGKARWVHHALGKLGIEYMALLLSWTWPGAGGLGSTWAKFPPARVYLCRWKIDFTGEGAPPMLNGWFIWDRAWQGETTLRMLDRVDDPRQGSLIE